MNSLNHPSPIYTPESCHPTFRLNWSLSIFWTIPIPDPSWLNGLRAALQPDSIRILNHMTPRDRVSQFLLGSGPSLSPADVVRLVKGRLQHIIRAVHPKAFHGNYFISSVGEVDRETIEHYVSSQLGHHRMADPRVQEKLQPFQFADPAVDLSAIQATSHGQFISNLHLVLVNHQRWMEIADDALGALRDIIMKTSVKHGLRLAAAGIFPDHLHLAVGCTALQSPQEVALSYMNNLAYAQRMRPIFEFGYYAGTFGEYNLSAIWRRTHEQKNGTGKKRVNVD